MNQILQLLSNIRPQDVVDIALLTAVAVAVAGTLNRKLPSSTAASSATTWPSPETVNSCTRTPSTPAGAAAATAGADTQANRGMANTTRAGEGTAGARPVRGRGLAHARRPYPVVPPGPERHRARAAAPQRG